MKYSAQLRLYTYVGAVLFCCILAVDQGTKYWARIVSHDRLLADTVAPSCSAPGPCLSVELVYNRGVSWGLFSSDSTLGFALLCLFICSLTAVLIGYAWMRARAGYVVWGETLVIAGSVSNVIDRFMHHAVIDFIRFSWGNFTWPIFNIADCCIVLGVCIMLVYHVFDR